VAHARGEIELEGDVLVLKRIHVRYSGVNIPTDKRDTADRALATHHQACPVARSIGAAIAITTDWAD
jgi:organic hydroperoxide reductase OsmC/OhrA